MSIDAAKGQLSQHMDALQKTWGLSADYSNESLSTGDVLQQCSIGDIAIISKLKPRQMQAFADSTSALGLRVVDVLSKLLEQQLPFSSEAAVSAALLKTQSGDATLDASSFVSVGLWHRTRKLNARLHKRHGGAAAAPAALLSAHAPASASSSDAGSSDSEDEGVPALLPFKADTARAANGALVASSGSLITVAPRDTRAQADAHAAFVIDSFAADIQAIFASETADAKAAARLVDAIRNCAGVSSAVQHGAAAATALNFKRRRGSAAPPADDATAFAKKNRKVKA